MVADWIKLCTDSIRDKLWRGSGVVKEKVFREALEGDAVGHIGTQPVFGSTTVPERWVLVIADQDGEDIYLEVEREEWLAYEVGDTYSKDAD